MLVNKHKACCLPYLIIVISVMLLCGCELTSDTDKKVKNQPMKIRVGLAMQPTSALLIIAADKGYFKEQGLDVQIKKYPSGKRALYDGLLTGEVDVVTLNETPFALAAFEHAELRAISGIYVDDNTNSIVARRDFSIQLPADLNGKKIATQQASAVHYFMHQFLVENDIDFDQIDISFYKAEQLVDKLIKGEIDAFSMREPYVSQAREVLKEKVVVFEERGIYTQVGFLVGNESYLNKNSIIVKKFLKALLKAEGYVRDNRNESARLISGYIGSAYDGFSVSFSQAEVRLRFDQLYINISEDIARWAVKKELVKGKTEIPNFLNNISAGFLKDVSPDSVSIIVN